MSPRGYPKPFGIYQTFEVVELLNNLPWLFKRTLQRLMILDLFIGANASIMKIFDASLIVTANSNIAVSPIMTSLLPVNAISGRVPEYCFK